MTFAARFVIPSAVRTAGVGLEFCAFLRPAYELRRSPADQDESDQNLPTISAPVCRDGKVIADHNKDDGDHHESIVLGTQLGLGA